MPLNLPGFSVGHLLKFIKSSCLNLYIPQKIKMTGFSPSFIDCPWTNSHFSRFSEELMDFDFEDIWKMARLSLI